MATPYLWVQALNRFVAKPVFRTFPAVAGDLECAVHHCRALWIGAILLIALSSQLLLRLAGFCKRSWPLLGFFAHLLYTHSCSVMTLQRPRRI